VAYVKARMFNMDQHGQKEALTLLNALEM